MSSVKEWLNAPLCSGDTDTDEYEEEKDMFWVYSDAKGMVEGCGFVV